MHIPNILWRQNLYGFSNVGHQSKLFVLGIEIARLLFRLLNHIAVFKTLRG
jgi:hypothetical protein